MFVVYRDDFEEDQHQVGSIEEEKERLEKIKEAQHSIYDVDRFPDEPFYHSSNGEITGVLVTKKHTDRLRKRAERNLNLAITLDIVADMEWNKIEFTSEDRLIALFVDDEEEAEKVESQIRDNEYVEFSGVEEQKVLAGLKIKKHPEY